LCELWSMTPTHDTHGGPVEEVPPGAGPNWGHLPHGQLTNVIIGAMFEVHNVLGPGFLEGIYANALTAELRRRGVTVDRNVPFEVMYRGMSVGRYVADLVVDQKVIVETKVAKAIDPVHRAQLLNYLRASGLEVGLVVNFGSSVQFKARRMDPTARPASRRGRVPQRQRQHLTRI
jgi:GxxExxY protein